MDRSHRKNRRPGRAVLLALLGAAVLFGLAGCAAKGADEPHAVTASIPPEEATDSPNVRDVAEERDGTNETDKTAEGQDMTAEPVKDDFYMTGITDELFERIRGISFKEDCTLPREDLRYLHVLCVDADGETHEGEMIVNYHIAADVLEILRELYANNYPIEKIRLVDEYGADDELSMEDNNSSGFNFRFISYTTRVSKHGLGLAIDINTLYNPYVKTVNGERSIEPYNGWPYVDRDAAFAYKIEKDDLCYRLFTERGFEWGGDWTDSKDYQHFEIPDEKVREWYPAF